MGSRHFLFDLDGTLIDSAPSIFECYRQVLDQFSIKPKLPVENNLIGPPLSETLRLISGVSDEKLITEMTGAFKTHYDTTGVEQSIAYSGINELLEKLHTQNQKLYIVTNKRIAAARKIIDFMNWSAYFAGIYAQDAFNPSLPSKAAVIEHVLNAHRISKTDALYIGDRIEDGEVAHANGLKFVWVGWGYGDPDSESHSLLNFEIVRDPGELEINYL
jgi:phosphoglycolate phosphatase